MEAQKSLTPAHAENLESTRTFTPAVDVHESKDDLLLVADVPGVKRDDISIRVERNELVVETKRPTENNGDRRRTRAAHGSFDAIRPRSSVRHDCKAPNGAAD